MIPGEADGSNPGAPPAESHIFLGDFGEPWEVWDVVSEEGRRLRFRAKHGAEYVTESDRGWFEMTIGELRMHLQRAILETDGDG
ncbi:MAG TPA: hypothetical protein VF035_05770 [Longimicrobiales bacterium]